MAWYVSFDVHLIVVHNRRLCYTGPAWPELDNNRKKRKRKMDTSNPLTNAFHCQIHNSRFYRSALTVSLRGVYTNNAMHLIRVSRKEKRRVQRWERRRRRRPFWGRRVPLFRPSLQKIRVGGPAWARAVQGANKAAGAGDALLQPAAAGGGGDKVYLYASWLMYGMPSFTHRL